MQVEIFQLQIKWIEYQIYICCLQNCLISFEILQKSIGKLIKWKKNAENLRWHKWADVFPREINLIQSALMPQKSENVHW
jgi:hypothetical protein